MSSATHPGWDELQAYAQGRLASEAATALERHLVGCPQCGELLERALGDSFVMRLRDASSAVTGVASGREGNPMDVSGLPVELFDHPRYRVLELIGRGGMGAVYRAEHRRMERAVALKIINPGLMRHPGRVERFQREVRAAARLQHPNIVHAYDADQAGELHFLVMEHIEGKSLAELVHARGPLPPDEACDYLRQAAIGLQHAHEQGMVHRDIKPQNLMVTDSSIVKILDFGLALLLRTPDMLSADEDASADLLTADGVVMGTADYIAPEQAFDPSNVDIRADIYSLGCTLFYLLTGHPPFLGGSVEEKLAQHAAADFPALGSVCPQAPAALAAVLGRMTARDPRARYSTPSEVAKALLPFSSPSGSRLHRRRRWWAASAALLAASVLVGAIAYQNRDRGDLPAPNHEGEGDPVAAPNRSPAEDEAAAIQAIQKLGGRVRQDDHIAGRPVVMVTLENTQATDADLQAVAAFKQLQQINLARTQISDAGLKHLAGLTQLTTLDLPFTAVTGTGLEHIRGLTQLEVLGLQYTRVGDEGMKHLVGLKQLRRLWLAHTRVTDAGMDDIGQLKRLTFLGLEETGVGDAGLQKLATLPELDALSLFHASRVSDRGMKHLARIRSLRSLDLCGTRVTDAGLHELAGLPLTSFHLGGLKVTDAGIQALAGMSDLQSLDLSKTGITDEGLKDIATHPHLVDLGLNYTGITDAGMKELAGLADLKSLALRNTAITDAGLVELARCPGLTFLSLMGSSKVTAGGVAGLQQARPKLTIQR